MIRFLLRAGVVVALMFLVCATVPYYRAGELYQQALVAEESDGFRAAAPRYGESVRWRSPGNRAAEQAQLRLERCAFGRDLAEPCDEQLLAVQHLRRGVLGSRSWLTDTEDRELLLRLRTLEEKLVGAGPVEELLPPQWNPWYQILAQCALWGWILSVAGMIFWGSDENGGVRIPQALRWGLCWAFCFGLWLFFLRFA
ncbi:hypothetical protein MRY87_05840 [bacterium]|nr:hypothetical protein [bacterium]